MRIAECIAFKQLLAGGPGSGCHGENCGRPAQMIKSDLPRAATRSIEDFVFGKNPTLKEWMVNNPVSITISRASVIAREGGSYSPHLKSIGVGTGFKSRWGLKDPYTTYTRFSGKWPEGKTEAIGLALVHEIGHHVHLGKADSETDRLVASAWKEKQLSGGKYISDYARSSPKEYFAEAFTAYLYRPALLREEDSIAYDLVVKVLRMVGMHQ